MTWWLPKLNSSRTGVALAIAALVNIWLSAAHPLRKAPTSNLDTGEVSQALEAFRNETERPEIVLLGSSLVLSPVMQSEANFLNASVERMTHRRSAFMEHALSALPNQPHVFCFAIGGAMVSDAFLIAKNVLEGKRQPDAIIFGIAPRDLQDNLLPGVQTTETFKVIATPSDTFEFIANTALPFDKALNTALCGISPLWKYSADLRTYSTLRLKKTMCQLLPWVVFDRFGPDRVLRPSRKGQLPDEVKGVSLVAPGLAMLHGTLEQTTKEYNRRYLPINQVGIDQQFAYLNDLLALCNKRHIRVLMINMPLSEQNLELLPSGFYEIYKRRLATVCKENETELVNLCLKPTTTNANFVDGVHLDTGEPSDRVLRFICTRFRNSNSQKPE